MFPLENWISESEILTNVQWALFPSNVSKADATNSVHISNLNLAAGFGHFEFGRRMCRAELHGKSNTHRVAKIKV